MASGLTINNLEQGVDFARRNRSPTKDTFLGDPEDGELAKFVARNAGTIFPVNLGDEIDCDKYNYYYERSQRVDGGYPGEYTTKISSEYDVKRILASKNDVYRVERKNRPFGEGFKNSVTGFFKKSDAPAGGAAAPAGDANAGGAPVETPVIAPADAPADAAATSGGRRSRRSKNQRKSRKSRKQRNERKSRKQRRSRR